MYKYQQEYEKLFREHFREPQKVRQKYFLVHQIYSSSFKFSSLIKYFLVLVDLDEIRLNFQ